MARLKQKYRDEVVPAMMKEFGYKNSMQVPRLEKITVNVGVGEATQNIKVLDTAVAEVTAITGQKPVVTRAKKSIANFKLREGVPIGCMVTLRQERMYEFLDRLIHLGLREQIIFPEIQADKVEKTRGMTVSFITNAKTDNEGRTLLKLLGMPFVS